MEEYAISVKDLKIRYRFPDLIAGNHLRESSNGRRAVSKTVNVGSIPASRAKRKII